MVKDAGFVYEAITQMENVVETSEDTEEMKANLKNLLLAKIKESFKNGLEIGMRGRGQDGRDRKPYRKFRR
ncbi:MAG: hypothetical protein C4567_17845 [Deltaproteobacteria bacterium]|nr:MAG: hypothetical protein C4567_17845 [Deltaproteobacteria bacterium]